MIETISLIANIILLILLLISISLTVTDETPSEKLIPYLQEIFSQLNQIKMDQEQLTAELAALKEQTEKAKAEIVAKIAALEDAIINAGEVSPAVQEALASLKTSVQGVDDIVPDAPPPAEEEEPA